MSAYLKIKQSLCGEEGMVNWIMGLVEGRIAVSFLHIFLIYIVLPQAVVFPTGQCIQVSTGQLVDFKGAYLNCGNSIRGRVNPLSSSTMVQASLPLLFTLKQSEILCS